MASAGWTENGEFITFENLAEANKYISNSDLAKFFRNQDEQASSTDRTRSSQAGQRPAWHAPRSSMRISSIRSSRSKGDYTNQITPHHRIQVGGSGAVHSLDMYRDASYLGAVDAKKQYYTENVGPQTDRVRRIHPGQDGVCGPDHQPGPARRHVESGCPGVHQLLRPVLDQMVAIDTLPACRSRSRSG